jgi:hypothetical protein
MRPIGGRAAIAMVACVAVVSVLVPAAAVSPAGAQRTFGNTPLDDVLYWADQHKKCGLSRDQLAAMMIPVTYPETGSPANQAPSPMTLSRWDDQSALYPFGNPGAYWDAFWHPGIGMYAFDSAGGWGMTAATRISTWSSSARIAETMANRWCANPSRAYVWTPWHACKTGKCDPIYDEIFQGGQLVNMQRTAAVERYGGMEQRTCVLNQTVTVTCWFVDPARAQGYVGWRNPAFGPSAISAPFYVYERNGNEYRKWMLEDTGYHTDISAWKPLGSNARTSLTWGFSRNFCDVWNLKGDCGSFRDVATNHAFYQAIEWMADTGISEGYPDQTFRPTAHVSRQAMAAFLHRLMGNPPASGSPPPFPDVPADHQFLAAIHWMVGAGVAEGFDDGTFRPLEPVTRSAMAAFLYRLAGSPPGPFPNPGFTDVAPNNLFYREIAWMAQQGITQGYGDGSFGADLIVTRAAMAAFLQRYAT